MAHTNGYSLLASRPERLEYMGVEEGVEAIAINAPPGHVADTSWCSVFMNGRILVCLHSNPLDSRDRFQTSQSVGFFGEKTNLQNTRRLSRLVTTCILDIAARIQYISFVRLKFAFIRHKDMGFFSASPQNCPALFFNIDCWHSIDFGQVSFHHENENYCLQHSSHLHAGCFIFYCHHHLNRVNYQFD